MVWVKFSSECTLSFSTAHFDQSQYENSYKILDYIHLKDIKHIASYLTLRPLKKDLKFLVGLSTRERVVFWQTSGLIWLMGTVMRGEITKTHLLCWHIRLSFLTCHLCCCGHQLEGPCQLPAGQCTGQQCLPTHSSGTWQHYTVSAGVASGRKASGTLGIHDCSNGSHFSLRVTHRVESKVTFLFYSGPSFRTSFVHLFGFLQSGVFLRRPQGHSH